MKKIVTFGEVMMRLTPSGNDLIIQANSFDAHFGGSEYNVAAGLVRLEVPSMCVTRLPDNPLGHRALAAIHSNGVETPDDVITPHGRLGIYFLEKGAAPRPNRVVYDRAGSSIVESADITPFDWETYFWDTGWFHVSGITPALGPPLLKATQDAIIEAKKIGIPVSFDINYRMKLWYPDEARLELEPLLRQCKVIVTTEEDLERVFGITGETAQEQALKAREYFGVEIVAITLREMKSVRENIWGGCAAGPDGYIESKKYDIEVIDRVGAGDSFTAGLIAGLQDGNLAHAVELSAAFSALKQSIPGDICLASREQAEDLITKGNAGRIQR